jgi:hypothetical protein
MSTKQKPKTDTKKTTKGATKEPAKKGKPKAAKGY